MREFSCAVPLCALHRCARQRYYQTASSDQPLAAASQLPVAAAQPPPLLLLLPLVRRTSLHLYMRGALRTSSMLTKMPFRGQTSASATMSVLATSARDLVVL